ncbi:MAG: hypothetical protein D3910_02635 [Candidatus Electrothrix sp. ATG2]|nr:hypothetical protein [Candidatus Electrothrix sp. ATG2]
MLLSATTPNIGVAIAALVATRNFPLVKAELPALATGVAAFAPPAFAAGAAIILASITFPPEL